MNLIKKSSFTSCIKDEGISAKGWTFAIAVQADVAICLAVLQPISKVLNGQGTERSEFTNTFKNKQAMSKRLNNPLGKNNGDEQN